MLLDLQKITAHVEQHIGEFHQTRINKIKDLSLRKILERKNPYLFKAKNLLSVSHLIQSVLDAFVSSSEETDFGNLLEGLAIFVNEMVYAGKKSGIPGIDLEFDRDGKRYLVAIKSGPHWGNSRAIKKMVDDFNTAKRTLRTSGVFVGQIEFVNGCCYGVDDNPLKAAGYYKYCGQRFWSLISGSDSLYEDLIVPLSHRAQELNDEMSVAFAVTKNRLVEEFVVRELTLPDGSINWTELVRIASRARKNSDPLHQ